MTEFDCVIRSERVVTPQGVGPAVVGLREGRVEALAHHEVPLRARDRVDLGKLALLPGGVDLGTGVHVPGHDLQWSYLAAAEAALAGGVTTLVASPAPARPAVISADALQVHRRAAAGAPVSVFLTGGLTQSSGPLDLTDLHAAGAVAFQCSLSDGGAPDMASVDDPRLRKAMAELATLEAVLFVHAEDACELGTPPVPAEQRPPRAERRGLERVIGAARVTGTRTHITPFTAAECAALLAASASVGVPLSAQTSPHYLCLPSEDLVPGSAAHAFRPPLRSDANRRALWSALTSSEEPTVTTVSSGHLPAHGLHTLAWSRSALWTALARRGLGLDTLARWTAEAPAALVGLGDKGSIGQGRDADLVAFDPEARTRVPSDDPGPYAGTRLRGRVEGVWVAGRRIPSA
ncbi:amidohydrolase family protein [Nocardiopsis xinjiangensis]|uniref:amidohydrolase family protein n=1 Tax=Nocardiopsis xinjiangensis TaxID=124285 RepID=UPI000349D0F5|nr:amidohydrolase family protein [Nocardiopsis xinjiangensis]